MQSNGDIITKEELINGLVGQLKVFFNDDEGGISVLDESVVRELLVKIYTEYEEYLTSGLSVSEQYLKASILKNQKSESKRQLEYRVKTKKLYVVANKIKKASGYQIVITQKSNKLKKKFNTKKGELNKKLKLNLKYQVKEGVIKVNSRNSIYVKVRPYFGKKNNKKYGKWSIKYKVPVYK